MIDRTTKLRLRRQFKRKQRQFEDMSSGAEEQLDKHFFRRLGRLYEVRRFIVSWMLLVVLLLGLTVVQTRALAGFYQSVRPLPGGIYSEGIVGSFTNANPIFATSETDVSVSHLLFATLMKYDSSNQLVGGLAKTLNTDPTGKVYTLTLKDGITWHDGKPLTSEDVMFTFAAIQNPDVRSPLFNSWQGINIAAPDAKSVTFTLPNILASFPYSLTVGMLPKHILGSTEPSTLRSALFNTTQPVGSGPFTWHGVEVTGTNVEDREQRISLTANPKYFDGKPKLNEFVIHTYLAEKDMREGFERGELTAMAGVQDLPEELMKDISISQYNIPVAGAVMSFFNTTEGILSDVQIRRALASATNQQKILLNLNYPSIGLKGPLLRTMLGYDGGVIERTYDPAGANQLLDGLGWVRGADGFRTKDGKKLTLTLNTLDTMEYAQVAHELQDDYKQVGAELVVTSIGQNELQTVIAGRSYNVLLYGIAIGPDPDQFAYWHSSQANVGAKGRLNFSNYNSKAADAALEAGRTRLDPNLRASKYKPFLEAWRDDVPALALYQPRFLYVSHGQVFNFNPKTINAQSDRYADVQKWMIRTDRVTNEF